MSLPTVLISGANQGLGFQAAKHLVASGRYKVLLGSRDVSKGEKARQDIVSGDASAAARLSVVQIDILSDDSIEAALATVKAKHGGKLDVLVNNAGADKVAGAKTKREALVQLHNLNVASHVAVTEAFLPLLKQSSYEKRRIVFVTSTLGSLTWAADPKHMYYADGRIGPDYRSSKSALNMHALNYSGVLKSEGIASFVVCPGWCATAFNNYSGPKKEEDGGKTIADAVENGSNEEVTGKFIDDDGNPPW